MRIAIDAHAFGMRLTGDKVYLRSLLNAAADGQWSAPTGQRLRPIEVGGALDSQTVQPAA